MTPADLRALIECTHGPRGQSAFGRAIGYSDRAVRRWIAGEGMSREAEAEVRAYAKRQGVEIEDRCPVCGHKTGTPPSEPRPKKA